MVYRIDLGLYGTQAASQPNDLKSLITNPDILFINEVENLSSGKFWWDDVPQYKHVWFLPYEQYFQAKINEFKGHQHEAVQIPIRSSTPPWWAHQDCL